MRDPEPKSGTKPKKTRANRGAGPTVQMNFLLPNELYQKLCAIAIDEERSPTQQGRLLLKEAILSFDRPPARAPFSPPVHPRTTHTVDPAILPQSRTAMVAKNSR